MMKTDFTTTSEPIFKESYTVISTCHPMSLFIFNSLHFEDTVQVMPGEKEKTAQ